MMKQKTLQLCYGILAIAAIINLNSCNGKWGPADTGANVRSLSANNWKGAPFSMSIKKAHGLYVVHDNDDRAKVPTQIYYLFNGTIKNATDKIYSKARITAMLWFLLENDKWLEDSDMNDIMFNDINASKGFEHWAPGETKEIPKIVCRSIPVAYASYPVKKVYVQYSIALEDKINGVKSSQVIVEDDITESWRLAVKRVNEGKSQFSYSDFPVKVLGGY